MRWWLNVLTSSVLTWGVLACGLTAMDGVSAESAIAERSIETVAAARAQAVPDMMLATPLRSGIHVPAYWVSEKLDGVRARWDGRDLITRGGMRISVPAWFLHGWPAQPLDGELWLGRGRFEATSGLVRRYHEQEDAAWREMKFMVFDLPADPQVFDVRLRRMQAVVSAARVPWLQVIPQYRLASLTQLQAKLREVVGGGGEGLMLHHARSRYQAGRSLNLLKLKPHLDSEARVLGHIPGKGKYTGMMGALSVQASDGRRFRLGTGFSDAQRAAPPPVGSVVTYRYNGVTRLGLPRFARFLRVRDEEPLRPP